MPPGAGSSIFPTPSHPDPHPLPWLNSQGLIAIWQNPLEDGSVFLGVNRSGSGLKTELDTVLPTAEFHSEAQALFSCRENNTQTLPKEQVWSSAPSLHILLPLVQDFTAG